MATRIVKIKDKFYDLGSTNTTFLQVAKDLKSLGIKNWYFMLELNDISLVQVDPYYKDNKTNRTLLTQDQISRVINECAINPWYYLREVSKIPDQGNPAGVKYKANRGNIAQAWCFLHGLDSWLNLPRRACCRV